MKGVKNLKVIGASLCLGATLLLSGCNDHEVQTSNTVVTLDENGLLRGHITKEDLDKVFVFRYSDEEETIRLVYAFEEKVYDEDINGFVTMVSYKDLKTGEDLLKYYYDLDENDTKHIISAYYGLIEQGPIIGFLTNCQVESNCEEIFIRDYNVEELLTLFEMKIKPTLESRNNELVK